MKAHRLLFLGVLTILALVLVQPAAAKAPDITSDTDVIALGTRTGPDGRPVQGFQIIHYRQGFGKPPGTPGGGGGGGGGGDTTSTCYAFLANGAKWKGTPEDWVVYAGNNEGLSPTEIMTAFNGAIGAWEGAASANIFGTGSPETGSLDLASTNGLNEVAFGDYASAGVIAVTNVWGYFSGPPSSRQLIEWDMLIDQADFDWSTTGADDAMDLQNIVTHEIGHAMGLGHPSDTCTEETMYRYGANGETKKRTLETGDIAGINALY